MNDFVSFETAKLLANKGFPQPPIQFGQILYVLPINHPIVCGTVYDSYLSKAPTVFAPRVTDLLKELGHDYYLSAENGHFTVRLSREMEIIAEGENIAEELAKFYLS